MYGLFLYADAMILLQKEEKQGRDARYKNNRLGTKSIWCLVFIVLYCILFYCIRNYDICLRLRSSMDATASATQNSDPSINQSITCDASPMFHILTAPISIHHYYCLIFLRSFFNTNPPVFLQVVATETRPHTLGDTCKSSRSLTPSLSLYTNHVAGYQRYPQTTRHMVVPKLLRLAIPSRQFLHFTHEKQHR